MKARVKETGEIVEVKIIDQLNEEEMYVEKLGEMSGRVFHITELDFDNLEVPDYWTRLEHQYAGMAMQGMLVSHRINSILENGDVIPAGIAMLSRSIAHALVETLKESK